MKTLFFILLFVFPASAIYAQPKFVRVSFTDEDTSKTMAVTWNSNSVSDPSEVQYGETKNYGLIASGTAFQGNGKLGAIHEVLLKELKPDTVYHYRVGGEGQWSGDYTFKTAPADLCKPVTFIALGDDRSDDSSGPNAKWGPILMQASDENPSFILNTGDLVKDGGEVDQWINWLEMSDPSPAQIPHMPVLGNHDDGPGEGDGANYNQIFNLPRNDVYNNEDFYFFTYGNIFVAGLSTQTFEEGNPPFSKQAEWLDKALTENPRMWKFVFFHHPNYTSYKDLFGLDLNHPPNEQTQNAALVPIFDKHHVDFVFSGHNHYYERFKPMKGGGGSNKGGDIVDSPDKGTQYIITGGAGALTYGLLNAVSLICAGTYASTKCAGEHHYVKITVENTKITLTVQATAAQLLGTDPKNSKVIETVSYEKKVPESENPCIPVVVPDEAAPEFADVPVVEFDDLSAAEEFAPDFVEAAPEITEIQEDIQTEETVQQTDNGKPNVDASDFPDNGKPNVDASDFPDGDVSIQPIKKTECGCKMTGSGIINPGEIAAVLFFLTVILFMRKRVSSQ